MNNQSEVEQVEISIEQAKQVIADMEALKRLTQNRDFKKLILEGYFEQEPIRLVLLKSDPSMQTEELQTSILKSMDSIGGLRQYFNHIMQSGYTAERALVEDEATREELLAEQV